MLTANRFDEIKTAVRAYQAKPHSITYTVQQVFGMLVDLAAEMDRMRQPAQAAGRGHIKPVVLDAQGNAVAPPPLAHQFAAERREQYDNDRLEAISDPDDIDKWRVFSLRWGLSPPPGGWENRAVITDVIHSVRLTVLRVPHLEKHKSAVYLRGKGIALPQGVTLIDGELRGTESLT